MISLPTISVPTGLGKYSTLLTKDSGNVKLAKSIGSKYKVYGLTLSPASTSGYQMCPKSTVGCRDGCLASSGLAGIFSSITAARIAKTKFFMEDRSAFLAQLRAELHRAVRLAKRDGKKLAIRANVLSDIKFEAIAPEIFEIEGIQWYDYTKIPSRLGKTPKSYYLTLSRSENNWEDCEKALMSGFNVAAVFGITPKQYKDEGFPKEFMGYKVISGEENDLRFLDKRGNPGNIVALVAKGSARKDTSGFVIRNF